MTKEKFTELILENEGIMCKVAMPMLRNEKDCEDAGTRNRNRHKIQERLSVKKG